MFRVVWSMRLKGFWIVGWFVVVRNIWLSGKVMGTMKIVGLRQLIWETLSRLLLSIWLSPFLGSQGPGGGVVLGIQPNIAFLGINYDL